ncbi:MAG TPA: DUF885 domain-containing protein [Terriglobales bacterium]|nr:DUF885 domain-containing protein [Terriglobales bacterium]
MRSVLLFLLLLMLLLPAVAAAAPAADLEARRKALNDLLAEQWEYTLKTSPEYASILGDKRYNDQLSDVSLKFVLDDLEMTRKFLARFEAIDTSGFPEQEGLSKALMVRDLKQQLDFARFKEWEMPVTQLGGPHLDTPQLVALLAFTNVKDYEDYVARLRKFPKVMDDTMDHMRHGMADHLMPPRFLLEKVATQADNIVTADVEKSPFAQPVQKFPDAISEADRKRLHDETLAAIRESINPAYARFAKFVREEYAPKGRTEAGIWSLPDGVPRYAAMVNRSTTSNLTPVEIHQIGVKQVAELEAQMLVIAQKLGYKDLKTLNADIEKDPKLHAHSRQQILDLYRNYTDTMWAQLPTAFGRLPRAKLEVMPIEEFHEKESATHYNQGTPDGSRPGHVMVNTGDFEHRKLISIESTAYHEGVPGHHMQISIAQELPELPPFRQQEFYGAYIEGWALYCEKLGKEMGFYKDPYSDYGRLQDEMLRAIRLVVDTGFHSQHWARQQVVDYFHAHSAIDEPDVQSETDRYIARPAQALSYKIGQLKILELREHARKQLGAKFDLRAFHDQVLGAGALPLNVLETRINEWVVAQNQGTGGTTVAK